MRNKWMIVFLIFIGLSLKAPADGWAKPIRLETFAGPFWDKLSGEEKTALTCGFLMGTKATVAQIAAYNPHYSTELYSYIIADVTVEYLVRALNYIYDQPSYRVIPIYSALGNYDKILEKINEGEVYENGVQH